MKICDKSKCTGCFVCVEICPQKAILIVEDDIGKTYAKIDELKCINCGLCGDACQINNPPIFNEPNHAVAARSNSPKDIYSSSGGVAMVLARHFISLNCVVYAVGYKDSKVQHIRIENELELENIRGSKYVQSIMNHTYYEVQADLEKKANVLYMGTPCQIAGLKRYLKKDYNNLVVIDIICHGVPPQKYLDEHTSKHVLNWDSISFRGEYDFKYTVYKKEKIIFQRDFLEDEYFCSFFKGLIFRDNCYICPYSKLDRCSDITIGDFWGLDHSSLKERYDGRISLVLINTNKGQDVFDEISNHLIWEKRDIKEAINPQQTNLIHPSKCHNDRKIFEQQYISKGFDYAVNATSLAPLIKKLQFINAIKRTKLGQFILKIKRRIYNCK